MTKLTHEEQALLAIRVATRAHAGQKRKDGTPYIAHPARVALRVSLRPAGNLIFALQAQTVAYLHDVVEDTDVTYDELRELGFNEVVISALDSVTKRTGETYAEFILRSKVNQVGRVVKLADIEDNLEDQSALDPEEAKFLRERYVKALDVLTDVGTYPWVGV